MTSYYLLRNNRESGPFSLKELKAASLLNTDLIWVNGESTCWKNPEEILELKGLAKSPEALTKGPGKVYTASTLDKVKNRHSAETPVQNYVTGEETAAEVSQEEPSFEELKKKYGAKKPGKKVWRKPLNIGANLIGIATMLIGVMLAAFMIKKAIDNVEYDSIIATAETHEIGDAEAFFNSSSQKAKNLVPTTAGFSSPNPDEKIVATDTVTSSVSTMTERVPALVTPTAKKKQVNTGSVKEKKDTAEGVVKPDKEDLAGVKENEEDKKQAEVPDAAEKPEKPQLQLTANEYKKGLFGGISNLELSVTNPGPQAINKATVEVEFLKPNGKVINSQTFEVTGIAPHSSKKITVPDNNRGVSVRYRVIHVEV